MTNRYAYVRLNTEDPVNRNESRHETDHDYPATKLRRMQSSPKKERWPGSAFHQPSHSPTGEPQNFIEHLIQPKETLAGLALQYRCSVFELKRVNNIQKEAEFFARRVLKIPVRKHSSLAELSPSPKDAIPLQADPNSPPSPATSSNSTEYLKQLDQDLERLKEKARVYDIDSNVDLQANVNNHPSSTRRRTGRSDCQGDDCGLSWTHILGLALLVLLACPLLYFLYLELNLHKIGMPSNVTAAHPAAQDDSLAVGIDNGTHHFPLLVSNGNHSDDS